MKLPFTGAIASEFAFEKTVAVEYLNAAIYFIRP
jgi:hypothetical protein